MKSQTNKIKLCFHEKPTHKCLPQVNTQHFTSPTVTLSIALDFGDRMTKMRMKAKKVPLQ